MACASPHFSKYLPFFWENGYITDCLICRYIYCLSVQPFSLQGCFPWKTNLTSLKNQFPGREAAGFYFFRT